jgi:hypothetical protein
MDEIPKGDGTKDVKVCVGCGNREERAKGQFWLNTGRIQLIPRKPLYGFHCSSCSRRGRELFRIALVILVVAIICMLIILSAYAN